MFEVFRPTGPQILGEAAILDHKNLLQRAPRPIADFRRGGEGGKGRGRGEEWKGRRGAA